MANCLMGARVVTPHTGRSDNAVWEPGMLLWENGKILHAGATRDVPDEVEIVSVEGMTVLPGFLDVHIHGGGGADTMDATPDALRTICRTHAANGTTGLLTTTMTQSREQITAALTNARAAFEAGTAFCPDGATVLGIHLEGPYISPEKPGAQPKAFVRDYDPEEFAHWLEVSGEALKRITLAPERPEANALIRACRNAGIVISLGHTDATAAQIKMALDSGATDATHLFNAMNGIHHRKPGPVPVFLTDDRATVEIIADGHHVAPEVVAMVVAAKGTDGVIAITDAMAGAGASDGIYDLGGNLVTVADGKAVLSDGTLAGSVLTMGQAARNLTAWLGLATSPKKWSTVAALTSGNAARRQGWQSKGRLVAGADADFVLVDESLNVQATYIAGKEVFRRNA